MAASMIAQDETYHGRKAAGVKPQFSDQGGEMTKMRTVPALVAFMAEVMGEPGSNLQNMARRAREAGYLSQAGRGITAALATSHDAATVR